MYKNHPPKVSSAHRHHASLMRTGWSFNPKHYSDRVDARKNLLIESWSVDAMKFDIDESYYPSLSTSFETTTSLKICMIRQEYGKSFSPTQALRLPFTRMCWMSLMGPFSIVPKWVTMSMPCTPRRTRSVRLWQKSKSEQGRAAQWFTTSRATLDEDEPLVVMISKQVRCTTRTQTCDCVLQQRKIPSHRKT